MSRMFSSGVWWCALVSGTRCLRPLTAGWLALVFASTAGAANLGFEDPLLPDGNPPGWTLNGSGDTELTDGDDGSDFSLYEKYGISVSPLQGAVSLRLGSPECRNHHRSSDRHHPGYDHHDCHNDGGKSKDKDKGGKSKSVEDDKKGHKDKSTNSALSDPFTPVGGSLRLSMRLFSFEHRGDDRLIIEILDADSDSGSPDLSGVRVAFEPRLPRTPGAQPIESATSGCTPGPYCALVIDIGKSSKRPFDSGEYLVQITGLPETPVRVRYSMIGGQNNAHASWVYFDNLSSPPLAQLRFNPGGDQANPALEGDFVVADCLGSTDADGDALSCHFEASGGGWQTPRSVDGDLAVFWFPDDGPAQITLTVTDPEGLESTVTRSVALLNAEPAVNALNLEVLTGTTGNVLCRFLDAGVGSYGVDGPVGGFEETHVLGGGLTASDFAEEHAPSFSSGYFRFPASAGGTCVVQDDDGGVGSDSFAVVEVDPATLRTRLGDEDRIEGVGGNDSFAAAHPVEADWQYLATIADPQDIDVYRVVRDGVSLPVGSQVVIALDELPTDFDLLVFSDGGSTESSPFFNAPFFNAPFFNAPFFNAPFINAPFFNAQFDSVPFFNAPFFNAPFINAPFFNAPVKKSPFFNADGVGPVFNRSFTDLPLAEVGLAAPDGSNISNSDISPAEIGSLSLKALQATPGFSLKALSAETGTQPEKVLVTVAPGEGNLYVVVVGNDLGFSSASPYRLSIEASTPPSQEQLLAGTGFCGPESVVPGDPGSGARYAPTWTAIGDPVPAGAQTVILTQRERLQIEQAGAADAAVAAGTYLNTTAYWSAFWNKVDEYAASVGGVVVSVAGNLYRQADENPCDVSVRNALAQTLRDTYVVNPTSGGWRTAGLGSLVIIGSQNVFPEFAVPDETRVGNERDFTNDLWVMPGTPLAVAAAEGFNLTDAPYTDLVPTPFRGRALYLEDKPVARLVESPAAITSKIDAFLRNLAGTATNAGRLAVGYDFFCDGTQEVAEILGVTPINGPPCGSSAWDADTLNREWLRGGAQMCLAPEAGPPLEIALVNAHMTTYAALSALGFETGAVTGDYSDTLSASSVEQCLDGVLTATIGCHSGLNIPDAWAVPAELNLPFDARRDWVGEPGFMIAPRGYGLGDNTVANRGTEGLITLVFEELAEGNTLGDALVTAKRRYVMGLREIDVHDEDSLINLALFAPPQLRYSLSAVQQAQSGQSSAAAASSSLWGTLSLKVREGQGDGTESFLVGSSGSPEIYDILRLEADDGRGSWFSLTPGDAQATYGRPLIPVTLPVEDRLVGASETRIHGVALVGRDAPVSPCPIDGSQRACSIAARYVDVENVDADALFDFNPVFPLPQHDRVRYEDSLNPDTPLEPQTCVETLAPTQLGVASTLDDGQSVRQSLVIGAGQFRCEGEEFRVDAPGQVVGQQRIYTALQMTALHPVGETAALLATRDADFDPPQPTRQSVLADPGTGTVTASVAASDALTGGSGISEIIALVYWDAGQTLSGESLVESYSAKPVGSLASEPFEYSFVLPNAANQRLAFQYIDGAGNLTQKSLKGTLIRAIEVDILTVLLNPAGGTSFSLSVGDYCTLQSPSMSYRIGDEPAVTFNLDDPPPGIGVEITEIPDPNDPLAPCNALIEVSGLDLTATPGSVTLTVEIRAQGSVGSDTQVLTACSDPNELLVEESADIIGCSFSVEAGDLVVIDMFIAGELSKDVKYKVHLPGFGADFWYIGLSQTHAPKGVELTVLEFPGGSGEPSQLQFRIGNLQKLGWDGVGSIDFQQSTWSRYWWNGKWIWKDSYKLADETVVFTGMP